MTTQTVTLRLVAEGGQLVGTVRATRKELGDLGASAQQAGAQAEQGFTRARRGVESISTQLARLRQEAIGFASAFASIQGVRAVARIADAYANITAQLRLATESQSAFARAEAEVFAISQRTSTALETTASLYARITRSTKEYGVEQSRVLALTETINQTFAISGTAAANQANAITQLTQAFAGGVLRAEEFNSVIENSPRLAQALADGLGIGIGELRAQVNAGTVDVQRMIAALESQSAAIQSEFAAMPLTIERSWVQLRNAVTAYIGQADQASGSSRAIAQAIAAVAENVDVLADGVVLVAGVLAGRLTGALASNAVAFAAAQIEAARYQATLAAMAGVSGTAAAAQLALGRAAMIGRGALSLFGGPLGLAVTGLTALYLWLNRAKDGADRLADIQPTVRSISELADEAERFNRGGPTITDAERQSIDAAHEQIRRYAEAINVLAQTRDRLISQGDALGAAAQQTEIDALTGRIRTATAEIQRFYAAKDRTGAGAGAVNKEFDQAIEKMREQVAMYGLVSNAAKLRAQIELGAYGALNAEQTAQLKRLAEELDAKDRLAAQDRERATALQAALAVEERQRELAEQNQKSIADTISALQQENALLADGLTLEQARQELRLRAQGATEAEISYIRELTRWQELHAESLGQTADAAQKVTEPFQDLRDVIVATGSDWAQSATAIVQGLENISKGTKTGVRGWAQLTQGAAGFFDEGSKGYKVLQAASQAFYAFEIAQQAASAIASLAASETKAAGHAIAAGAAGAEAVAVQASGGPYVGFALAAAMVAFLASLGISPRGRGGGGAAAPSVPQADFNRGTGTVYGDADAMSESIANATELTAEATQDLVGINVQMLFSLRQIAAGIQDVGGRLYGLTTEASGGLRGNRVSNTALVAANAPLEMAFNPLAIMSPHFWNGILGTAFGENLRQLPVLGDFLANVSAWGDDLISGISNAMFGGRERVRGQGIQIMADNFAALMEEMAVQSFTVIRRSGGLFGNSSTRTEFGEVDDALARQFQLIFRSIGDAAISAAEGLGVSAEQAIALLSDLELPDIRIDTQGKTAEEIAEQLSAQMSAVFDTVAQTLVPWIDEFAHIGEGAGETLARVSVQTLIVRDAFDNLGLSLETWSGVTHYTIQTFERDGQQFATAFAQYVMRPLNDFEWAALGEELATLAGGLEALQANLAAFQDFALTDAQKFDILRGQLEGLFGQFDLSLPATREGVLALVQSLEGQLDATGELGEQAREAFTAITAASPALAAFFDQMEDFAAAAYDVRTALGLNDGLDDLRAALGDVGLTLDQVKQAAQATGRDGLAELLGGLSDAQLAGLEPFIDTILDLVPASQQAAGSIASLIGNLTSQIFSVQRQIATVGLSGSGLALAQAGFSLEDNLAAAGDDEEARALAQQLYDLQVALIGAQEAAARAAEQQRRDTAAAEARQQAELREAERQFSIGESLQRRILELNEDTAAIRALELADLNEANQALQLYVWSLEDAAEAAQKAEAIASERAGLETQLLQLQGDTTELRRREREQLDKSNRALYDQIKALEDTKAAAEAAAAAQARMADLQIRLLRALGDETGALALTRQRELDAATDAERTLLRQIFAAEDAQATAQAAAEAQRAAADAAARAAQAAQARNQERLGLENQILTLLGATVELRRRERAELAASNRALFDQLTRLQDQQAALQDVSKTYDEILQSLAAFRRSLAEESAAATGGSIDAARRAFADVERRARLGETEALRALPDVGGRLAEVSREMAATQVDYLRDLARIQQAVSAAEGVATRQKSLAEQQFDELAEQTLLLIGIKDNLDALRASAIAVPGFAHGGAHAGGWRVVGENGPELEYTGPSRIYNAGDSARLLGGTEVVAELQRLRGELQQLRDTVERGQFQIALNTGKTATHTERQADQIEIWADDGIPVAA